MPIQNASFKLSRRKRRNSTSEKSSGNITTGRKEATPGYRKGEEPTLLLTFISFASSSRIKTFGIRSGWEMSSQPTPAEPLFYTREDKTSRIISDKWRQSCYLFAYFDPENVQNKSNWCNNFSWAKRESSDVTSNKETFFSSFSFLSNMTLKAAVWQNLFFLLLCCCRRRWISLSFFIFIHTLLPVSQTYDWNRRQQKFLNKFCFCFYYSKKNRREI